MVFLLSQLTTNRPKQTSLHIVSVISPNRTNNAGICLAECDAVLKYKFDIHIPVAVFKWAGLLVYNNDSLYF